MAIFRRGSPNWGKNRECIANSMDRGVKFITADADDDRHASVNVVYDSKG